MNKRGKVVRDTNAGTGLISIDGQQFPFELEGMWKSDVAPCVNMVVEVDFGADGRVASVQVVPESQLAREQAEAAMRATKDKGAALGKEMVARFGAGTLAGMAALVCGWFVFNTITVQIAAGYSSGLSFWKVLGVLNSPLGFMNALGGAGGGSGAYGLFAVLALCGPLLPFFVRNPLAHLANLLPLLFIAAVCAIGYFGLMDGLKQAQGAALAFGGRQAAAMAAEMASGMMKEALRAVSFGLGAYLSVLASLYFAGRGAIKYLSSRA
ncbi:hypothetical protein [Herbaspirillum sp.]|uniref:hypothetical protein n=1 Tax=Herbaspirillum sp. TaxID=1890675 RepID=UPI0031DDA3AB